ncbi:hypothetical protein LCGC14_3113560 [marine sediment metagenome]|uniref:DUF4031 domain-containing protein n=1 Tax=marine sediment metagenome TaxID=412755 RepID=A0A0F8W4C2_9ZZZZ
MAVYVDSARLPYGRMVMCHMIADTSSELHAMTSKLGLSRRWCQHEGTRKEHYDVSLSKRVQAVGWGAQEIDNRELVQRLRRQP